MGAGVNEHAETAPGLDQSFIDQFLVGFENGERVDARFGRDLANRKERIAFFEDAVEDHGDDAVTQLPVDRLTIVPFMIHETSPTLKEEGVGIARVDCRLSYSVIVKYNTNGLARSFSKFFWGGHS